MSIVAQRGDDLPRYFFDLRDRSLSHDDEIGSECESMDAVKDRAQQLLGQTVADEKFHRDGLHIVVCVRDELGKKVFMATMLVVGNTL